MILCGVFHVVRECRMVSFSGVSHVSLNVTDLDVSQRS
jgi:hypothetical protein